MLNAHALTNIWPAIDCSVYFHQSAATSHRKVFQKVVRDLRDKWERQWKSVRSTGTLVTAGDASLRNVLCSLLSRSHSTEDLQRQVLAQRMNGDHHIGRVTHHGLAEPPEVLKRQHLLVQVSGRRKSGILVHRAPHYRVFRGILGNTPVEFKRAGKGGHRLSIKHHQALDVRYPCSDHRGNMNDDALLLSHRTVYKLAALGFGNYSARVSIALEIYAFHIQGRPYRGRK